MMRVLTLLIAVIAVYVAYQQWKTNALKLKLDLYDRRFRVFEAFRELLRVSIAKGDVRKEEIAEFVSRTVEAEFLFGKEIRDYVEETYRHGVELSSKMDQLRAAHETTAGPDVRKPLADAIAAELKWLLDQPKVVTATFGKYLDVNNLDEKIWEHVISMCRDAITVCRNIFR